MSLSRALCSLSLLAILAGASASAWALPQPQGRGPEQRRDQGRQQDSQRNPQQGHQRRDDQSALSDAVRRAERATRGQVLSAERVQFDGRDVNRVKVVDDRGRVRVYWDDPQAQEDDGASDGRDTPRRRRTRDEDDDSD